MSTTTPEISVTNGVSISRTLVVVLLGGGVFLPALTNHERRRLGLAELIVIESLAMADHGALATTVAAIGMDQSALSTFVKELSTRQLVIDVHDQVDRPRTGREDDEQPIELSPIGADPIVIPTPLVLRVGSDGFEAIDHEGRRQVCLDAHELLLAAELCRPMRMSRLLKRHRAAAREAALSEVEVRNTVARLLATGVARHVEPNSSTSVGRKAHEYRDVVRQEASLAAVIKRRLAEIDQAERARREETGIDRVRIVPVQHNGTLAPLALGMLFAYAMSHESGRLQDRYQFYPSWLTRVDDVDELIEPGPALFVFSNYHWSHADNLAVSSAVNQASPLTLTVHGGPDTPRYEADVEAYFDAHPSVDIVVHGEGEVTFSEMLDALDITATNGASRTDLEALASVAGLSYRRTDGSVHRTADRDRIVDLDTIPSPYLTGMFDAYGEATAPTAIIESNRGCPYGCTFCDWGSATLSRIRKFDLDRVLDEIEWCAEHGVPKIFMADANFGIFKRDVQIAQKVADMNTACGFPKSFVTNYAKNTVKHLRHIVEIMVGAGIFTEGLLSLQSMDETTLKIINRSNIKLEKYEQLAREFRLAGLPLYVDLMLGLPGATISSFKDDLQQCVDREVTAKVFLTELLVNSPMNDPAYRAQHKITTATDRHGVYADKPVAEGTTNRALLVSTDSYTRSDYEEMKRIRAAFMLCENYGVLRHVSRHVHQSVGLREIDLYDQLRMVVRDDRERLPHMAVLLEVVPKLMVSPVSWRLFLDEIHAYLADEVGVPDDSTLATAFSVQLALLPSQHRALPVTVELPHDFVAWHQAILDAKDAGHNQDWPTVVPELASFGPGVLEVEDAFDVCTRGLGYPMDNDGYGNWEMRSAVSRPLAPRHLI